MVWEGVEGVASPVEERVGGAEEGVESVGLSVGEGGRQLGIFLYFLF